MPTKLHAGAKRDRRNPTVAVVALSIAVVIRTDYFRRLRHTGTPRPNRAPEIRCVVLRNVSLGRNRARLADVPVFPLKTPISHGSQGLSLQIPKPRQNCGIQSPMLS